MNEDGPYRKTKEWDDRGREKGGSRRSEAVEEKVGQAQEGLVQKNLIGGKGGMASVTKGRAPKGKKELGDESRGVRRAGGDR